jgi:hypothetical protein
MYRLLARHAEIRERRDQLKHPAYSKPELLAGGLWALTTYGPEFLRIIPPWIPIV